MSKTALITGASSGIGRELTRIHAEKGGHSVITAQDEAPLFDLKRELENKYPVNITVITADLTHPESPMQIYNKINNAGIQIDYLINNAGFGGSGLFHEREWKNESAMIHLNIIALSALTHLFLPDFVNRSNGKILNVSSLASLMPGPRMAVYYATKAYVTSFSNALYEELQETGVTITTLLPGATNTNFGKVAGIEKTPLFRNTSSARKVAEDGYHGMIKGRLNVLTGLTFSQKLLTPFIPFTPKKILLKIIRKLHAKK